MEKALKFKYYYNTIFIAQAVSSSADSTPVSVSQPFPEGEDGETKVSDWNHLYFPTEPIELPIKGKKNRKR